MKLGEKDDIFIHRMLEETYSFLPERESGRVSTDLLAYFLKQNKVNQLTAKTNAYDLFKELGLEQISCEFIEAISCFRFEISSTKIDVPVNWSFFNKIFVSYQAGREDFFDVAKEEDASGFLEVINLLTPFSCHLAFWVEDQKITLLLISEEKKAMLPELEKKLGLENLDPKKKAA